MFEYAATVIRVIDGDTIEADLDLGFRIHLHTYIRLAGLNAPELRMPNGAASRDHLVSLLIAPILVKTRLGHEFEKYGRVLGDIVASGVDVNAAMIAAGFAVKSEQKGL